MNDVCTVTRSIKLRHTKFNKKKIFCLFNYRKCSVNRYSYLIYFCTFSKLYQRHVSYVIYYNYYNNTSSKMTRLLLFVGNNVIIIKIRCVSIKHNFFSLKISVFYSVMYRFTNLRLHTGSPQLQTT